LLARLTGTPRGADSLSTVTGGRRYVSITGYFLATPRVADSTNFQLNQIESNMLFRKLGATCFTDQKTAACKTVRYDSPQSNSPI
jgi:hypothetical protein